jgi:hypothetical protein
VAHHQECGYVPNATSSPALDDRANEALSDEDRPLVEAFLAPHFLASASSEAYQAFRALVTSSSFINASWWGVSRGDRGSVLTDSAGPLTVGRNRSSVGRLASRAQWNLEASATSSAGLLVALGT